MALPPDERYAKTLLYYTILSEFFEWSASFGTFARLIFSARFILSPADGRLYDLAYELFYLVEETEDDPEVLAEINKDPVKGTPYLSVDEAMPQLRKYYDEIYEMYKPYLP